MQNSIFWKKMIKITYLAKKIPEVCYFSNFFSKGCDFANFYFSEAWYIFLIFKLRYFEKLFFDVIS